MHYKNYKKKLLDFAFKISEKNYMYAPGPKGQQELFF